MNAHSKRAMWDSYLLVSAFDRNDRSQPWPRSKSKVRTTLDPVPVDSCFGINQPTYYSRMKAYSTHKGMLFSKIKINIHIENVAELLLFLGHILVQKARTCSSCITRQSGGIFSGWKQWKILERLLPFFQEIAKPMAPNIDSLVAPQRTYFKRNLDKINTSSLLQSFQRFYLTRS